MKKIFFTSLAIFFLQLFNSSLYAQTPSIVCPANKIVPTNTNSCNAVVNNIDPVVSPTGALYSYHISTTNEGGPGSASGKTFPLGVTTVTYTLSDYPTVSCSFTVTVQDKTPPVIMCPPNQTYK